MDNEYDIGDSITLEGLVALLPTKGKMERGSSLLHIADPTGWADADPIIVVGAAPLGGDLVTSVTSRSGYVFTLAAAAGTSVFDADVGKLSAATIELTVLQPTLGPDDVAAAPVSTGRYRGTFVPTEAGDHFYRFSASGQVVGEGERRFHVRERRVP